MQTSVGEGGNFQHEKEKGVANRKRSFQIHFFPPKHAHPHPRIRQLYFSTLYDIDSALSTGTSKVCDFLHAMFCPFPFLVVPGASIIDFVLILFSCPLFWHV